MIIVVVFHIMFVLGRNCALFGYILLPPVAVVAGCDMLIVTGNVGVLLVAMSDTFCKLIFKTGTSTMVQNLLSFKFFRFFILQGIYLLVFK